MIREKGLKLRVKRCSARYHHTNYASNDYTDIDNITYCCHEYSTQFKGQ